MNPAFATTRWTLVLAAGRGAERALGELCAAYRSPLVAHARRRGLPTADAEDAAQGFFERLLRLDSLASARRERGRFRSFILGSFEHYLADLRDRDRAEKRGAALTRHLDSGAWAALPSAGEVAPDAAFDRAWAIALLETTLDRLRAEQAAAGKADWFEALAPCLAGRANDTPQTELAARLGVSEAALRVAVHRLRKRYREILRDEVAQTVASDADVEAELRHLLAAVSAA